MDKSTDMVKNKKTHIQLNIGTLRTPLNCTHMLPGKLVQGPAVLPVPRHAPRLHLLAAGK